MKEKNFLQMSRIGKNDPFCDEDMKENIEIQNLMGQIQNLQSDVESLTDLNKKLAWLLHDKDKAIEEMVSIISTLRDMLKNLDYYGGVMYH